jgi:hypothetical protein
MLMGPPQWGHGCGQPQAIAHPAIAQQPTFSRSREGAAQQGAIQSRVPFFHTSGELSLSDSWPVEG